MQVLDRKVRVVPMAGTRAQVRSLLRALLAHDQTSVCQIMGLALAVKGQRVAIISDLVQAAVSALDDLWYRGEIRASDEEWAIGTLLDGAETMPGTPSIDPVPPGSRIVLAGLGQEQHGIGLGLLGMALEDDGWDVAQLGPETPPERLLEVATQPRADVVGVSASYLPQPGRLAQVLAPIKARRIKVMVGGQAFGRVHGLWQLVGADGYGVDARAGVAMARRLLPASRRTVLVVSEKPALPAGSVTSPEQS